MTFVLKGLIKAFLAGQIQFFLVLNFTRIRKPGLNLEEVIQIIYINYIFNSIQINIYYIFKVFAAEPEFRI